MAIPAASEPAAAMVQEASEKNTTCAVCIRLFYLPFRWGKECPHTFCLECLWQSLQTYDLDCLPNQPSCDPITACPLCRSAEYEFKFDEEMEQYMLINGIDSERSREDYEALHIRFLYICMCGVFSDSIMIIELSHRFNRVVFADRDPAHFSNDAPISPKFLAEFDAQLQTAQLKNSDPDPDVQKMNALLSLHNHILVRKLQGHLKRVRFAAPEMQGELEFNISNYYKW
ncbi:hypothetical protein EMCG_03090 [[Emmonsia] crescens]|uniref:RING-type domain-containing protein n=1 Tax=[Emmonsia] crescens TaxID=73230 RepID=A0A0G2HWP7_9EURO|nr:hypothetical protein EMCG_03090 [Emmonsia crescens UAMH 3008]